MRFITLRRLLFLCSAGLTLSPLAYAQEYLYIECTETEITRFNYDPNGEVDRSWRETEVYRVSGSSFQRWGSRGWGEDLCDQPGLACKINDLQISVYQVDKNSCDGKRIFPGADSWYSYGISRVDGDFASWIYTCVASKPNLSAVTTGMCASTDNPETRRAF